MKIFIGLLLLISIKSYALTELHLDKSILNSSKLDFITHTGTPTSFNNALALNIEYHQIKRLREVLMDELGIKINFLTAWNFSGEAHVTTISPPEYKNVLRHFISMKKINEIAISLDIQGADLTVLGLGSGSTKMGGHIEETFFLIVDSNKLRKIRHAIYQEFVKNGGDPSAFDPTWFFPHITIGYTKKDIHENNGLLKDIKHSFDKRFLIQFIR